VVRSRIPEGRPWLERRTCFLIAPRLTPVRVLRSIARMGDCAVRSYVIVLSWFLLSLVDVRGVRAAPHFRLATYNLENYLLAPVDSRPVKPALARAQIRESLRAIKADVVALQEVGGTNALFELRNALMREGLSYPHWELVHGWDTNIQVAILSQWPIVARRPQTNDAFLLFGRKFRVSRGFLEVDLRIHDRYTFTLITVHLKSRRPVPEADEAELREQEARILREKIEARLSRAPNANLVVIGDLNDVQDSLSTRAVIGKGRFGLIDTRPAERPGGTLAPMQRRQVTWTHYYGKEDTYSRVDYILLSKGMAREWNRDDTYILTLPNWGEGSDHRPIVAGFLAEER
jgi:endonuclease/exonuclease/phosphatase family metal-dependent hydrolase